MKHRRFLQLTGGLGLALTISIGWLWHSLSKTRYEAFARIAPPQAAGVKADDDPSSSLALAEVLLGSDVLSAAADLLHERRLPLPLASPFDSESEFLFERLNLKHDVEGNSEVVRLTCTADDPDQSLQIVAAVVDAYFAAVVGADGMAPDAAVAEAEAERRQVASAIERQQLEISTLNERLELPAEMAEVDSAGEIARLENLLVEARRLRMEAERQFAEVRRDLVENKLPAEAVAARLADGPLRATILERSNLARLQEDLKSQRAQFQKWSMIYGRNHPRMAEVRARMDLLDQRISSALNGIADLPEAADSAFLVLQPLERELATRRDAEQELQVRLDGLKADLSTRQHVATQLGEARQELAFLHGEHDRLRKQIDSKRHEQASQMPRLVEAPTLSAEPLAPEAGLQMTVVCLTGLGLLLVLGWKFLGWRPARRPEPLSETARPQRRERFRSREEQQVRLKMLGIKS